MGPFGRDIWQKICQFCEWPELFTLTTVCSASRTHSLRALKYIKIGDRTPLAKRFYEKLFYRGASAENWTNVGPLSILYLKPRNVIWYLKPSDATNGRYVTIGIAPVCPIEIVADNMVLLTFFRFLLQTVPDCMKHFYVGDFGAIANGDEAVLRFIFLNKKK